MSRDLRHVLWFMAALMPLMIAATLLTSGADTRIHHTLPVSGAAGKVISVKQLDARQDVAAVDPKHDRNSTEPD